MELRTETGGRGPQAVRFLIVLSAVYTGLLLFQIDSQSLWLDEILSVSAAQDSWGGMWQFFRLLPEQHPLYYLLLRAWMVVGTSDLSVRLLSALFALMSLWAVYGLADALAGPRVARLSALFLVVSPFYLYFGQEARMYSLLGLLAALNGLSYVRWTRGGSRWAAAAYILTAVLGVYTHLYFHFLLIAQLCHQVLGNRANLKRIRWFLLAQAGVALSYLPWAVMILQRGSAEQTWKNVSNVVFAIPYTLFRFTVGYSIVFPNRGWRDHVIELLAESAWLVIPASICGVVLAGAGLHYLWVRDRDAGRYVGATLLVPFAVVTALSLVVIIAGERYFVVCFPAYVVLIASGVVALRQGGGMRRHMGTLLATVLAGVIGVSLANYYLNEEYGKEQWKDVARLLGSRTVGTDRVVVHEGYTARALLRYYAPPDGQNVVESTRFPADSVVSAERLWLVESHSRDGGAYEGVIGTTHVVIEEWVFPHQSGIVVQRWEPARHALAGAGAGRWPSGSPR